MTDIPPQQHANPLNEYRDKHGEQKPEKEADGVSHRGRQHAFRQCGCLFAGLGFVPDSLGHYATPSQRLGITAQSSLAALYCLRIASATKLMAWRSEERRGGKRDDTGSTTRQ